MIEFACLLVLTAVQIINGQWLGFRALRKKPLYFIQCILIILMAVEASIVVAKQKDDFRILRIFRPVFLMSNFYCTGPRRIWREMILCIPPLLNVLALLLSFMFMFAIAAFYLFGDNSRDPNFDSFIHSFMSLFVLITTANYPDVMMPSYEQNRVNFFFFFTYLYLGLYFLMNLVLAVVYDEFRKREEEKCKRLYLHRRAALRHVHKLLKDETKGGIPFTKFRGLMRHRRPGLSALRIRLLFMVLDSSETDSLGMREFYNLFSAEKLEWRHEKKKENMADRVPPKNITARARKKSGEMKRPAAVGIFP